jgi:hypothetical protein
MRPLSIAVASFLAAFLLASCGGGSDSVPAPNGASAVDVTQIEALGAHFAAAVKDKDAEAFCKLLAPADVVRLGAGETNGQKRCLIVWGPAHNPLFAAKHPNLRLTRITKLKIPDASAKLANGGRLTFLRTGGAWYVDLAPAKK